MSSNDLLEIFDNFGLPTQQRKLAEEVFEFQESVTLHERGIEDIEHVIEELADVFVVLYQFKEHLDINEEELHNKMMEKILRTKRRIKEGYYK